MIVVDHREEASIVPSELQKLGVPIKLAQLEVGDYIVCGKENVCVERKDAKDYVGSLVSGRLNNQLVNMSRHFGYSILLVEGSVSEGLFDSNTSRGAFLSSLVGSVVKRAPDGKSGTISVICVETQYDSTYCLKFLHEKVSSEDGLVRLPKLNPLSFPEGEYAEVMLGTIPLIGPKTAKALLREFRTIQNVSNASVEELMRVEDVGKKKASNIFGAFRKYYSDE